MDNKEIDKVRRNIIKHSLAYANKVINDKVYDNFNLQELVNEYNGWQIPVKISNKLHKRTTATIGKIEDTIYIKTQSGDIIDTLSKKNLKKILYYYIDSFIKNLTTTRRKT